MEVGCGWAPKETVTLGSGAWAKLRVTACMSGSMEIATKDNSKTASNTAKAHKGSQMAISIKASTPGANPTGMESTTGRTAAISRVPSRTDCDRDMECGKKDREQAINMKDNTWLIKNMAMVSFLGLLEIYTKVTTRKI